MLRRELEVTEREEIIDILDSALVLHLGLCDGDQPYVLSMNYGYEFEGEKLILYIHGGKHGYKYEVMDKNPKVCVEISSDIKPFKGKVACQYGMSYASIIAKGTAEQITDSKEKQKALITLMTTQTGESEDKFMFDDKLASIVRVYKLTISEYTAKKRPVPPVTHA